MKTKKKSEFSKLPSGDKALLIVAYAILGLFLVAIILPIIYIILASFIDPVTLQNSGLTFDFSKWTLTAYERVLGNAQIWVGFKNALIYSVLFTRSDPYLPADLQPGHAGYHLGHPHPRRFQCVEHDHCPYLLHGNSPRPAGSGGD